MADQSDRQVDKTDVPKGGVEPAKIVGAEQSEQNRGRWRETFSPKRADQLDEWIAIEPDGQVTVFSGKVELGTGVRTALAQIVADELDVRLEQIRMVMGDTERTPNEGYTAGSKTIQLGGVALREASAEARQALLEMAGDRLDAAHDELMVEDGVVSVRGRPERRVSYAELMGGKRFNRVVSGKAPQKRPGDYRVVGQPRARFDIPAKLTGEPSFVHDLRLPGMLHGRVIRPPRPGAKLISLDRSGVPDLPDLQLIQDGDFVGLVAEREEDLDRAAAALKVIWEENKSYPPMGELFQFLQRQPTQEQVVTASGDVMGGFERAAIELQAEYHQPYQNHASMGPSCGVADYSNGSVRVWSSTQGVYPLRNAISDLLDLPQDNVHVIHVEGPGCYGHNGSEDAAADAAVLSRAAGRPVRVRWTREDEFRWEPKAPAMVMKASGGLDKRGNIVSWEYDVWSPPHSTRPQRGLDLLAGQLLSGEEPPGRGWFGGGDRNAPTDYRLPNQRVMIHWIARSPLRASSMRSLGGAANTFANESFIDELAAAAGRDPVEFRLAHLDDPRARAVIEAAAKQASWRPHPRGTAHGEAKATGEGIAFARYENREAYIAAVAQVEVDTTTGHLDVRRIVVAHDCGLIINPDGLRNQIEGNIIQSLSRAIKEEVRFDEQGILSLDWESYPILTFSEVPEVEVVLLNRPEEPPVGAGEPATITTAAAVANAIYDATGARVRQVPLTAARIREALAQQKGL